MEEEYDRWNDPGIITVKKASEEETRRMRKETLNEMVDFFKECADEYINEKKETQK